VSSSSSKWCWLQAERGLLYSLYYYNFAIILPKFQFVLLLLLTFCLSSLGGDCLECNLFPSGARRPAGRGGKLNKTGGEQKQSPIAPEALQWPPIISWPGGTGAGGKWRANNRLLRTVSGGRASLATVLLFYWLAANCASGEHDSCSSESHKNGRRACEPRGHANGRGEVVLTLCWPHQSMGAHPVGSLARHAQTVSGRRTVSSPQTVS